MHAIVIAGGLGTRLRPLTFNRPKALVPLLNRPQVLHILDRLPKEIDEVFVAVNYMYDRVRDFFSEADLGRRVHVIEEKTPLGTAGAVKNAASRIDGTFAVYNGDVIDSLDFTTFLAFHRRQKALATLAPGSLRASGPGPEPRRSDALAELRSGKVHGLTAKVAP